MKRPLFFCLAVVSATFFLAAQATAWPHFRPRIRLPKVNLGKGVGAVTYPVTKSLVNGGKTVFKTAATAETLGVLPGIGPPSVNNVAKKIIVGIGKH
ncbi:MAG: hypothetical protein M3Y13_04030 [Armatimonadota bacterium]|nr:hypothetical protein [Armatimonadota bacterium]